MVQQNAAKWLTKDRSYHQTSSPYPLPNDPTEHRRLDDQGAAVLALMNNQLLHAPITSTPTRILDIGCGTGATTVQLARQFPSATVIGLDLSPVPALLSSSPTCPPNARGIQGDFLDPSFAHPEVRASSFDLVFSRFLVMGVNDWDAFYARAVVALAPGGWVETQDVDQVWYDADGACCSDGWRWLRAMTAAAARRGLDMSCASRTAGRMEEVGLVEVGAQRWVLPLGEWERYPEADAAAQFARRTLRASLEGALVRMLREDGVGEEELEGLREGMLGEEVWDRGVHRLLTVTWGQKP
ncbi:S-adenosyl-L-methionine-dependent methyltransferase [Macrophomina phaseolina]|uniref:S-adenosyl-L-methionine-dependent methyltransferase n=1 Tax=Macrophomina phaseolina TaxID=35725 RepID=A0ABQ8GGU9_9PEZI|nr:S-adenosyl-L-methionine-dependent methyltransferase [Macrophomina phaseolina]